MSFQKIIEKVRSWFVHPEDSASRKDKLSIKAIGVTAMIVALAIFTLSSVISSWEDEKQAAKDSPFQNPDTGPNKAQPSQSGGKNPPAVDPDAGAFRALLGSPLHLQIRGGSAQPSQVGKNHNANQIIPRAENGGNPDSDLPMGYGIAVKLVNSIQSGENTTPVIAEVIDDVTSKTDLAIPKGTRAIGQASVDDSAKRIQVHFQTLVYPEGDQHSVQGLALMPDGSAGLTGDYHSGSGTRQLGRFLGTFIGGMAEGMTEKQSAGLMGSYEVGSVKNGLLTGVSQSATDQTRMLTDDLSNTKPTMTLPSGQSFILYLEKGYQP